GSVSVSRRRRAPCGADGTDRKIACNHSGPAATTASRSKPASAASRSPEEDLHGQSEGVFLGNFQVTCLRRVLLIRCQKSTSACFAGLGCLFFRFCLPKHGESCASRWHASHNLTAIILWREQ